MRGVIKIRKFSPGVKTFLDTGNNREGRQVRYSLVGITATATLLELTHASGIKVTIPLG
jgi:hypothetical protein